MTASGAWPHAAPTMAATMGRGASRTPIGPRPAAAIQKIPAARSPGWRLSAMPPSAIQAKVADRGTTARGFVRLT